MDDELRRLIGVGATGLAVLLTVHEGQLQLWVGDDLRRSDDAEAFIQAGLEVLDGAMASGH